MRRAPARLRPSVPAAAALVAALVAQAPSTAEAQPLPSVDLRTFRAPMDPRATLVLEPTVTPGAGALHFAAFSSYALRPVALSGPGGVVARPVEHQAGLEFVAGLGLGERGLLSAIVPVSFQASGGAPPPGTLSGGRLPASALADSALALKIALLPNPEGGLGIAATTALSLPTGSREAFVGEGAVTSTTKLFAEYTLIVASVQASLGVKVRGAERTWPDPAYGGTTFGHELPFSFGFAVRPAIFRMDAEDRQRWELAIRGSLPLSPVGPFGAGLPGSATQTPVMLSAADRIGLGRTRDAYVVAGVDLGLDRAVGVPAVRAILGIGWAPQDHDQDGDGIPDDRDQCPPLAEDKDGFEDDDGCPEIDDDDDGIVDAEDACPRVVGSPSDDPKRNGCPAEDRDHDGVPDELDACPDQAGPEREERERNGCPAGDRDGDGVDDAVDRCPDQPEDKDGFEDDDGCPDPDDDRDGVPDALDACPREPGAASTERASSGCPVWDRDGDGVADADDKCPDEPETYNGVADDDGCPDRGGEPLVRESVGPAGRPRLALRVPVAFEGAVGAEAVAKKSGAAVRALGVALRRTPGVVLAVGVRPGGSLSRALALASAIARSAGSDRVKAVSWDVVKGEPSADATGVGFLVVPEPAGPSEGRRLPLESAKP